MDEILYPGIRPQEDVRPAGAGQRESLRRRMEDLLFRWDSFKHRLRPRAGGFLATALLVGAVTTAFTVYTGGYAVVVDGQELGVVADTAQFETIQSRVEDRVSQILDRPYTMSGHVNYVFRVVDKSKLSSLAGFETYLFNQVDEVTRGYVLSMDGQTLTVQSSADQVEALLDSLKAPYVNENTVVAEFTAPLSLHYEYVGVNEVDGNLDQVTKLLTSNTVEAATYTVKSGDTASAVAQANGMTLDELMDMNPQADANHLSIGQELTVQRSVPFLEVRTVDQVTYEESVPAPVEYVDDASMYQGDSKVLDAGSAGTNLVTARITSLNGVESARDITNTQVLTQPTTKVVARGTKERPKTMPKGYFIWPVNGPITSGYGSRTLFGTYNFHGGIDIYVPTGTSVKAADGGTVVTSGWHNSYGYYIVIDHGNGFTTYYAHNSQLLVNVGEKVYQGQVISRSGATGNVTGPHVHFEVRINGQRQNPRGYLS